MASSDEAEERTVVSKVETMDSRRDHGIFGDLRRDDPDRRRKAMFKLTGASWVVAAGTYGYIAATFGSEYPEHAWLFMVFGMAAAGGFAGMLALSVGDDDGE